MPLLDKEGWSKWRECLVQRTEPEPANPQKELPMLPMQDARKESPGYRIMAACLEKAGLSARLIEEGGKFGQILQGAVSDINEIMSRRYLSGVRSALLDDRAETVAVNAILQLRQAGVLG